MHVCVYMYLLFVYAYIYVGIYYIYAHSYIYLYIYIYTFAYYICKEVNYRYILHVYMLTHIIYIYMFAVVPRALQWVWRNVLKSWGSCGFCRGCPEAARRVFLISAMIRGAHRGCSLEPFS